MQCIECFHTHGDIRQADFLVNGHSVCQKHVHVVIVNRADTGTAWSGRVYAWPLDESAEPEAIDV